MFATIQSTCSTVGPTESPAIGLEAHQEGPAYLKVQEGGVACLTRAGFSLEIAATWSTRNGEGA